MQISEAAKLWLEYHKSHSKENSKSIDLRPPETCGQAQSQHPGKGDSTQSENFPELNGAAGEMVTKAGIVVRIRLRPHDLRRHAATYASRSGVPTEIASQRSYCDNSNLPTTERYLVKISDIEA